MVDVDAIWMMGVETDILELLLSDMSACSSYLRDGYVALFGQLFLGLPAGVGVGQVAVEVFVENFRGLLAEVPPLPPSVQKA